MLLLDAEIRDMLSSTLFNKWQVEDMYQVRAISTGGLLNKPIQKLRVKHDGIETKIAIKTQGNEPRLLFRSLYEKFGCANLRQLDDFDLYCSYLSMREMSARERIFYKSHTDAINDFIPMFYGCVQKDNLSYLLMEDLSGCRCINQIEHPKCWGEPEIKLAIETMAYFHTIPLCVADMPVQSECASSHNGIASFLESFTMSMRLYSGMERITVIDAAVEKFISRLSFYEGVLGMYGKQLIHHDYNIRNICIDRYVWKLKVYDWEFIDYENPLMDMADFLISLSAQALETPLLEKWLGIYQNRLSQYGVCVGMEEIKYQLYCSLMKFAATRMNMYLLFYCKKKDAYMERMYTNLALLLSVLGTQIEL